MMQSFINRQRAEIPPSGDHHHFVLNEASDKLLIFFTATGAPAGRFNWWSAGHELSDSANILFVNGWSNTWYQDGVRGIGESLDETIRNLKAWQEENEIRRVFCTGQSMGGHGALLFSALLGGKAIAFGAETLLGLPHSQYSRKANPTVAPTHPNLPAGFKRSLDALLVAGERDPVDLYCARQMLGVPGVTVKTMRGVGHGPAGYLKIRDRLVPLLRGWLDGEPFPEFPEEGSALSRDGYPEFLYQGWCDIRDKNGPSACYNMAAAVELYPASEEARLQYGNALMLEERFREAFEQFSSSFALFRRRESLTGAAIALRRMGAAKEAIYTHRQVLKLWPEHAEAWHSLGLCMLNAGDIDRAISAFRRATVLQPKNENYSRRLLLTQKKKREARAR